MTEGRPEAGSGAKVTLIVAVIGLVGTLGAAFFANIDKMFPPAPVAPNLGYPKNMRDPNGAIGAHPARRGGNVVFDLQQNRSSQFLVWLVTLFGAALWTSSANGEAAAAIEASTEELRALTSSGNVAADEKVATLEAAIKRGERASAGLRTQIESLQAEKQSLEDEKRALEKIQVVLTSGLIGALVTALVAIIGTFVNFSRGRAERDLKRLEVLEKSVELESKGIHVPVDIQAAYAGKAAV